MLSKDLSVSELSRMTGLAIDETWNCATAATDAGCISVCCSPEWHADSLLCAPPSSLPVDGAVRVESRSGDANWDAEWPIALDVHWLREITPGFPLGARPVRVLPATPVQARVRLQGDFVTLVWRTSTGETRVQVALELGSAAPAVRLEAAVPSFAALPTVMDELLRALTGSTSTEWLRGVFADSCSLRWKELATRIGARPDQLDDLAMYFRALTTTEEDAVWRAASSTKDLFALQPWVEALAFGQTNCFEDLLQDALQHDGPAFWRGTAGELLNIAAGSAMACVTTPVTAARLIEPARKVLSLLIRDDLASLLVRLRAVADEEWAVLAPWYRSRIEESCGTLSADLGVERVMDEVSLWMKKLQQRIHLRSLEAVRQRAQAAISSEIVTSVSEGCGSVILADMAVASSTEGDRIVGRILSGNLRSCLEPSSPPSLGVRLLSGLLNDIRGRRIAVEVLLPFFQKKSWATAREDLAAAEIHQTGDGQLTIAGSGGTDEWSVARETAALLLSAVFSSRSEAPSDDMIHMVHEDRRTLQRNEADVAWLRLIRAYGLSAPELPAGRCEATLRVEAPWNWAEAWCHLPVKRDAGYLDKFMHLSLTIQEMARHWLPALCLATPQQFDAPNAVLPLLVYAASQPHANLRKAELGYDALSPFRVERAAASAVGRLPELLEPLYQCLRASGRSQIAEFYSPDRARLIVSAVQRKPRPLAALLAGDTFFLEHCFQLTTICRELRAVAGRNPVQALRKLAQASEEIVKASLRGLKRHYPNQMYHGLGTVYLLEATRALASGAAGAGFRASLTLETGTGVQRFAAAA